MRPRVLPAAVSVSLCVFAVIFVSSPAAASGVTGGRGSFGGWTPMDYPALNTLGCHSNASFPVPPSIDPRSGIIRFLSTAVSAGCGGPFSFALAFAVLGLESPAFSVRSTGTYSALFRWTLSFGALLWANGPDDNASAFAVVFAMGVLYDETNGSFLTSPGGSAAPFAKGIHSGLFLVDLNRISVALNDTVTLVAGHVYQFQTWIETAVEATLRPAGFAFASLDFVTDGRGARLDSVSLRG